MQKENKELGEMPVGKLLVKLAIPAILAQVINALYNIVDRIYIGRMGEAGSLAIAGLGIAFPIVMIVSACSYMIGMGGGPRASIAMGQGDYDRAEKILGNAVTTLVMMAIPITIIVFCWKETLLSMFGATENILPYAVDYLGIYILGSVFVMITMGLNNFITCQGFSKYSMITVAIGAILNIILDPILIFGFDMGVKGSALATVIAQGVSSIWVLSFLFGKKTVLKIRKKNLRIRASILLPVLALGVSPFIMSSTESLVQITLNSGMKKYGGLQADQLVSITTIAISTIQFFMMPVNGLVQGAQPIISYNYGAGNIDRVKKAFCYTLIVALSYSVSLWLISMLVPQVFICIFTSGEAARKIIPLGKPALRIFLGGVFALGAQYCCQNTFMALGEAKVSLFLALWRKVFLLVPLALIFPIFFGAKGIFAAECIADVLAASVTVTVFYFKSKKLWRIEK